MPPDPRESRRTRLRARLEAEAVDGLIVTHPPNLRYLTGFTGTAGVLLVLPSACVLVTDFRYEIQAADEVGDHARVEIVSSDVWSRVWSVLGEAARVETMGFEAHTVTVAQADRFREGEGRRWRFRAVRGLVEGLRVTKGPGEVAAIREAAALAQEALADVLPTVRVGQRERDIAARLEAALRTRGSEWHPFPTIVASGPRSALPHAHTGDRLVAAGDWLLIDFGARLDGYCADLTRTVVVGARADERQRTVYRLVRDAQEAAIGGARAGMTGAEADALARSCITARGFGDAFGHSLGHGLGLEVHEAPRLSRTNTEPLPDGAVVTIEPGIYLPGWGGVRLEDDVLLTTDGVERLSEGSTELCELV